MLNSDLFYYKNMTFKPYWSKTSIPLTKDGWNIAINACPETLQSFHDKLIVLLEDNVADFIIDKDNKTFLKLSKDYLIELDKNIKDAREAMLDIINDINTHSFNLSPLDSLRRINAILYKYSQIDGSHHKAWCLNEILKSQLGMNPEAYRKWVNNYEFGSEEPGEDAEKEYEWDKGIAP